MADFTTAVTQQPTLSEAKQKKMTQAGGTDMDSEHKEFVSLIIGMLDRNEIDLLNPSSVLKDEHYRKLSERDRAAVDYALTLVVDELRQIEMFYRDKKTPNASPELQNMIEHLWNSKSRVEEKYGDVFKI